LFPGPNVCSFNCVYCFRGGAQVHAPYIENYIVTPAVLRSALEEAIHRLGDDAEKLSAIDFSGNGEPTLHPLFDELVMEARALINDKGLSTSLGVFTNSTRLCSPRVRNALAFLDHVEAKLDTVIGWKFELINEPARGIFLHDVIKCLSTVRGVFGGTLALQVMLLRYCGIDNYAISDAEEMASIISSVIQPDEVHLYTAYAPPRMRCVEKATSDAMERFATTLREHGIRVATYPE
jgi:wyosine [tRNA(Phe)-imidazoG37] synthetase (radical SAM superfamily)